MKRIVPLILFASITTPALADGHCPAPQTPLPPYDVIRSIEEGASYTQAHTLTHRAALLARRRDIIATCESDPASFDARCDVGDYPTIEDVAPEFLNLPEADFDRLVQEMADETYLLNQRLEACMLEGSDQSDG